MAGAALILLLLLPTLVVSTEDRPDVDDVPKFGRWLVSQGKWGVVGVNTPSSVPFTYPASYADAGKGSPFFYFSKADPVGREVEQLDARACFTVSEATVNGCQGAEPQSPTCSKITLSGQLRKLPADSKEESRAKKAFLEAHPAFKGFPTTNGTFSVYKLKIEEIFLVNKPAPARDLTVEAYLAAE